MNLKRNKQAARQSHDKQLTTLSDNSHTPAQMAQPEYVLRPADTRGEVWSQTSIQCRWTA